MKTTINFNVKLRHTSSSGVATIVSSYAEGLNIASEHFDGNYKTESIGINDDFMIYENYQDSGSNDYIYFAVKRDV